MFVFVSLCFVEYSTLQGIWMGMLTGTFLQMVILLTVILTTNWDKQVLLHLLPVKNFILRKPCLKNFYLVNVCFEKLCMKVGVTITGRSNRSENGGMGRKGEPTTNEISTYR